MKIRDKILEQINKNPGITLVELANNFSKSKGNISIHLKNLEKNELIKKLFINGNQKIIRLHPTKKGKELYLKFKLELIYKL